MGAIHTLAVTGTNVYIGGWFGIVGQHGRNYIAALDVNTGEVTPWAPDADDEIYVLALQGTTIYVGGRFSRIGGGQRNNLAALDLVTGVATPWNPAIDGWVSALALGDPSIYADAALSRIGDAAIFARLQKSGDDHTNSLAILVRHLSYNFISR